MTESRISFSATYELLERADGWYVRECISGRGGASEYGPCADRDAAKTLRDQHAAKTVRAAAAALEHISENLFRSVWPRN